MICFLQVDDLSGIQQAVRKTVNEMFKARSGDPVADAEMKFAGRSFIEIASDCWGDQENFLKDSHALMARVGLATTAYDENLFVKSLALEWPPTAGQIVRTHILNWCTADRRSFWKNFIPDKEVYTIAMGIAMDKFREATSLANPACAS